MRASYARPTAAIYGGCTYCFIHEETHTNVRFISCDGHQLYYFKESGVDLEVEGVRYIEMHRGPHTYWARLLQGARVDLELQARGRTQCVLVKIWRST